MSYKLIISDRIEFDVKFSLNDGGEAKHFGAKLAAKRIARDVLQAKFDAGVTVGDLLNEQGVVMLEWIGKSPLINAETEDPVPAGAVALTALQDLVSGMTSLVYAGFLESNGAKGKSGN